MQAWKKSELNHLFFNLSLGYPTYCTFLHTDTDVWLWMYDTRQEQDEWRWGVGIGREGGQAGSVLLDVMCLHGYNFIHILYSMSWVICLNHFVVKFMFTFVKVIPLICKMKIGSKRINMLCQIQLLYIVCAKVQWQMNCGPKGAWL